MTKRSRHLATTDALSSRHHGAVSRRKAHTSVGLRVFPLPWLPPAHCYAPHTGKCRLGRKATGPAQLAHPELHTAWYSIGIKPYPDHGRHSREADLVRQSTAQRQDGKRKQPGFCRQRRACCEAYLAWRSLPVSQLDRTR